MSEEFQLDPQLTRDHDGERERVMDSCAVGPLLGGDAVKSRTDTVALAWYEMENFALYPINLTVSKK